MANQSFNKNSKNILIWIRERYNKIRKSRRANKKPPVQVVFYYIAISMNAIF